MHEQLKRIVDGLNEAEKHEAVVRGHALFDTWHLKERTKFYAIDVGHSGAFLVAKDSGEIYNIQGYGRPDRTKKVKADLGNIRDVNPAFLHTKRWNYLR